MPEIPPPASIGKYRIEREIGRGASGVVYLGLDGFRGKQVAIKQMHAHLLADPAQAQRYRRLLRNEAMLAGRLRHPHIVRLLDADEEAVPPYLVLEYVQGRPLSDFAKADSLLPVAQVLDIAFKCGQALEHAQRQGLVHRDIKPANILLSEEGEVKLADFGAALSVRSEATQIAGLVGSPSYMSPEQVREEPLTHHSDMFSLAVVVYELLTGRRPFDGDTDYATMFRIGNDVPVPPSLLRPALPTELDQWLLRAESVKTVQKALRSEIPEASSLGLAQAEAQTTVRQITNAFGPRLSADPRPPAQVPGQPGLWRLPVAIRGPVTQPQLASILWRIEGSDRLIVVDDLTITFVKRMPSVAMTVTAYYRVATPAGTGNARP